jgi:hypothetical protein
LGWALLALLAGCGDDPQGGQGAGEANNGANQDPTEDAGGDAGEDAGEDLGGDDAGEQDATEEDAELDAQGCRDDAQCDDGVFCNGVERCFEGVCFESPQAPCADLTDCTVDRCDEEDDQCTHVPDASLCAQGQVCDPKAGCFTRAQCVRDEDCNDGLRCNGDEVCVNEECAPGEPVVCDDGVACTADGCVEEGDEACQFTADHELCLPTELCSFLEGCVPRPPCTTDDECDDGLICNGAETCDTAQGECVPGPRPVLDDQVECTLDACSDRLGQVLHTPAPARCNDGEFCNGIELCRPDVGCVEGEPPALSDGLDCTQDRCDEAGDVVLHEPDDARCDDGRFCNGPEACHPVDGCVPTDPPVVNDGVGCTIDACDEIDDRVTHVPDDGACSDSLYCNGPEVCDPVEDCQRGAAPVVDDELACTADRCDEGRDVVVHDYSACECEQDADCVGVCQVGACVRGACVFVAADVGAACDDGVDCTVQDACDAQQNCGGVADDARCDDGLYCNGAEVCEALFGCQDGLSPQVSDEVGCTADACDELNDRVTHVPNHAACSDGQFCNGEEVCDLDLDCQAGTAPTLDDRVGCTVDACDEVNDRVTNTPMNARCDDGLYCNGAETCSMTQDCQPGLAPALEDGIPCTDGACDEQNNRVVQTPVNARCDDGQLCNGAEVCTVGVGCGDGPDPARGAVCDDAPRSVCLDGACSVSECGDGFPDPANNEQCDDGNDDDGDACRNNCTSNTAVDYNGTYGLLPDITYRCANGLVNYSITSVNLAINGNSVIATGYNNAPTQMVGTLNGNTFSATATIYADPDGFGIGGCDETYTIAGTFSSPTMWSGTFTRTFTISPGIFAGCGNCTNNVATITRATRQ